MMGKAGVAGAKAAAIGPPMDDSQQQMIKVSPRRDHELGLGGVHVKPAANRRRVWLYVILGVALVALVVVVAVIAASRTMGGSIGPTCAEQVTGEAEAAVFERFGTCGAMFEALRSGSCGWQYGAAFGGPMVLESAGAGTSSSSSTSNSPGASSAGGSDFSGTNVQEVGVDEEDIVKTDGKYVYTLAVRQWQRQTLTIANITDGPESASVVSRLNLEALYDVSTATGLFVNGDRLLVVGRSWFNLALDDSSDTLPTSSYSFESVTVLVFNIADRARPSLIRRVDVEGQPLSARMVGKDVHVVIGTYPHWYAYTLPAESVVPEDILPLTRDSEGGIGVSDGSSRQATPSFLPATDCSSVGFPSSINIDGTVTIMSLSLAQGAELLPLHTTTVAGRGFNVYASPSSLFVASSNFNWIRESTSVLTFDLIAGDYSGATPVAPRSAFRGVGDVPGTILSRWSMDEGPGQMLRVATNTNEWSMPIATRVPGGVTNVYVVNTTKEATNATSSLFPVVGTLTGLAPGERIKASRYFGDRLYLVTFVTIDPLFVINLTNPEQPVVLGELKIPGFSEYLHPLNDTHLIGVGQTAATVSGRTFTTGLKLSLFDVSNVSNPLEPFSLEFGGRGSYSEVLADAKAFLWDARNDLLVMPAKLYEETADVSDVGVFEYQGALVIQLTSAGFSIVGGVSHKNPPQVYPPTSGVQCSCTWDDAVLRSLYVGDTLYTVSNQALVATSLASLSLTNITRVALV